MRAFLGLDTSCYTTSIAAVSETGEILSSQRMLLPVSLGQRGLRQSEAVFAHIRQLPKVAAELHQDVPDLEIVAIGASARPVDRDESYMPVFMAGYSQAQVMTSVLGIPCYALSHQAGHIRAGWVGNPMPGKPYLALHLSGGTTELLYCKGDITPIGGSSDLHAGQLIDRVGVKLGLGFPSGPELEKLAMSCESKPSAILPVSMARGDLDCHLSGAEAGCMRLIEKGELTRPQIALELFDLIARTIARLLIAGRKQTGCDTALIVGGVASSTLLRTLLTARLQKLGCPLAVHFGQPRLSGDNAVGIAYLTYERFTGKED